MTGQELQRLLADHQPFHSALQMELFILAKEGGTEYGCYKQALRELSKRYRGLKGLLIEQALLLVEIDELEEKIQANGGTKFDLCRNELRLTQKQMNAEDMERTIADMCREFARFYAQAVELKARVGELTPEKREELDERMWEHRLKSRVAVELLALGHIREETIATIQVCWTELRDELRDALSVQNGNRYKQHEIVEWYLGQEPVLADCAELMPPEQVMKFLQEGP